MITVSTPSTPSIPTVILDGESISSSVFGMGGLGRLSFFFFGRSLALATGGFSDRGLLLVDAAAFGLGIRCHGRTRVTRMSFVRNRSGA